jgi:hypothetical protein
MTPLSQLKAVEYPPESTLPVSAPQPASSTRSLFLGPSGLRVGWRLLIFIGLLVVLFGAAALVSHGGPQGLYALTGWAVAFLMAGLCEEFLKPWWLWFLAATILRIVIQCR